MKKVNENNSAKKKALRIAFLIICLLLVIATIVTLLMEKWVVFFAFLAVSILMISPVAIKIRTVGAHYDPMLEESGYKRGQDMKIHPEDIPVNPWDQMIGNEEQTENK